MLTARLAIHALPYLLLILVGFAWHGNHGHLVSKYEALDAEFLRYRLENAELSSKAASEALRKLEEQQAINRTIESAAQQSELIDYARDAEQVRNQLIACQAVVRSIVN